MLKSFILAALATIAAVSAQLTISTPPSLVQCQPVLINWSGGSAPYILTVIPGGQTGAAALTTISNDASGTSISWTVDIASGTSVTLQIVDSTGSRQYSSPLTIQAGSSNSCLSAASGSGSSAAGSGSASMTSMASSASGMSSMMSSMMGSSSMMMSSSGMASSATGAATTSMSSGSMTMSMSGSATRSSAAATTSGAAYKKYEVPAAILAAVGGVAALF